MCNTETGGGSSSSSKKSRLDPATTANLDADDPVDEDNESESESDDDDTAELLAELAKIKKERAAEAAQKVLIWLLCEVYIWKSFFY